MSRRAQDRLAQDAVASWIKSLRESQTTPAGLPDDVLVQALEGYGGKSLSWPALRSKAQQFHRFISVHVKDCTIRRVLRRPTPGKSAAGSVSIFIPVAAPLRQSETLFGANIHTFTFWPSGLWVLSTTDPLYTTNHLHQRLVERASDRHKLAEAQDSLSLLWPTLVELGQQRRRLGRSANVANFVTPLANGLIFGELQRVDLNVEEANSYAPTVIDFNNGLGLERQLRDFFYNGRKRTIVIVRTYVGGNKLKPNQLRLKQTLERYISRHRAAIECLMLWPRLSFDAEPPYGPAHRDLFTNSLPDFPNALSELDEITSSDDWRSEIERSIENRSRRKHAYRN